MRELITVAEDYITSANVCGLVNLGIDQSTAEKLISLDREIQSQLEIIRANMK